MKQDQHITTPQQVFPEEGATDTIGARIRSARKSLDLNQEALAARLGVTQPTVANWEADVHNPRQLMLAKLAEALGVSLGWLAGGESATRTTLPLAGSGYVARGLFHVPVMPAHLLTAQASLTDEALHNSAVDYIPISARSGRYFAVFLNPGPFTKEFPGETLFVFDATRSKVVHGCYGLLVGPEGPYLHVWQANQTNGADEILGTLAITVRFF